MQIFHIATASDWAAAQQTGRYTTSTRGRTLAEEGFIHASRGDQWLVVRQRFYADVEEPLVLLAIEPGLLTSPVVEESVADSDETFPHVYGPINVEAVVTVLPLDHPGETEVARPANPVHAAHDVQVAPPRWRLLAGMFVKLFVGLGVGVVIARGIHRRRWARAPS